MKENRLDVTRFKKWLINNKGSVLTYFEDVLLHWINSVRCFIRI